MVRVWQRLVTSRPFYLILPPQLRTRLLIATLLFFLVQSLHFSAQAACGGTVRTWDAGAGSTNWSDANNWSSNLIPNSTGEDVVIVSGATIPNLDTSYTVGCVEIQSGTLNATTNNRTLTISGDYFRNLNLNSLNITRTSVTIHMNGTAAQTFENYDLVEQLTIGNATSDQDVTITKPFTLNTQLNFTAGWTGTLNINADVRYNGGAFTIPANSTVVIGNGAKLSIANNNITVAGTLKLMPGASIDFNSGRTITVNAGGSLIVAGASGNSGKIQSPGGTFTFAVNGIINANYFFFSNMDTNGLNIGATGVIQKLDNGEFHFPPTNGNLITLANGSNLPATFNQVGFTNDSNTTGVRNINSAYTGAGVTINNWTGGLGGNANERADAGNRITWGTQGGTKLTVTDLSAPAATINQNTLATGATFAFALNQTGTVTSITSVKISMVGTATASDIDYIELYYDVAGSMNCVYNNGVDLSIAGQVAMSGSPLNYTFTIPTNTVTTSSDTSRHCVHVRYRTTTTAADAKTVKFAISGTNDVANSQSYAFSDSASPPVITAPDTYIIGDAVRKWQGDTSTAWNTGTNWNGGVPSATRDCQVGAGTRTTNLDAAGVCQNAVLLTGGSLNFGAVNRVLDLKGGLQINSGFNFLTPTNVGSLTFTGTVTQGLSVATPVPANVTITNTGVAGNDYIEINGDTTIGDLSGNGGDVTVANGILRVNAPYTLTVKGNLVCSALAGNMIEIAPGATLKMGNNKTITINNGCTLKMVGTSIANAVVTSDSSSNSYNVIVNSGGTISARYYTFSNLGTNGLRIAGTIDATNHLQNGTFTYPIGTNGKMLDLDVVVPTHSMDNMNFDLGGSSATGTVNIDTATIGTAGTLTLNNYTGDLAGPSFDNDPTYLVSWLGATNTIEITQEATSPGTLAAGSTYNMGRFGFKQVLAGPSYQPTDVTSLKLTLTGTASSNDISDVKVYYDNNCDGAGGTLIGSGTLSGNPASRTFTFTAGQFTIDADQTSPPKRCIYVEYVMAAGAINGNTAGVQIASVNDIVNSQAYTIDSGTQPPITLGTPGTITGASTVTWLGTNSTAWATGSNWSTGAAPTSAQNCVIDNSTFDPVISVAGAVCKSVTIGNGILTINTGQKLSVYGGFTNTGTLTLTGTATIEFADGGVASNQSISSSSTLARISFAKTGGGNVNISSSTLTITNLVTVAAGQNFDFLVPSGKNLTLTGGATIDDGSLTINGGGTVTMGNATTLTIGAAGALNMIGSSSSSVATITGGSNKFNAAINGTIAARYYKFDHLSAAGVNIASGATIDVTNHLQDCEFNYPVDNNTTMLTLNRQVPTDTMANCRFDKGGSAATGPKNISTSSVSAGTLTLDQYLGDIAGDTFETQGSYVINWTGGMNTIDVTQDAATALGSVTAPSTANLMGRFAFKQTVAGAGFSDANITSLKLTLKGTATASDISAVRIYSETDCNSAGGTLIGTGTFSGSPATSTFTLSAGNAVILHHATTPPKVCIYVEYDIPSGATNGATVGVEVNASTHASNDQGFLANPSTSYPVHLGAAIAISGATSTTWTGTTSTDPTVASNWGGTLPTSTINCNIPTVGTNAPTLSGAMTLTCKSVNLTGSMTMSGGTWNVNGDFTNSGTLTNSGGTLTFAGTANQNFSSSSTIFSVAFSKTAGTVFVTGTNVPITTISFAGGSGYTFTVNNAKATTITNSFAVATGKTLQVAAGGTLKMGNGTTLTIDSGGTLKMVGTSSTVLATMTSSGSSAAYNVAVNGTIEARYFTFDHLNTAGVNIASGATINATNHLQDCNFTYPVNNSTTLLKINKVIPTNTMDNCKFDKAGSAATTITTIDASGTAGGGATLTLNSWSGNLGGGGDIDSGTYTVTWSGGVNTINITRDAAGPANVVAGSTYNMGRFGFQQVLAGATYSDTEITSLKLTTTGTATASDISQVRVYYDSDCDSTAGTLIGSGSFSGSPLTKTFTFVTGDAIIPMHATAPPKRCIYVEMDIAAGATNANTISAKINAAADFVDSPVYVAATAYPVSLSTTPATITGSSNTTWVGTTSTAWTTGTNWTNGVPDSTKNCTLVNVTNDPVISGTVACKNVSIGNGILTINTGGKLQVYGNYDNASGSVTMSGTGTIEITDATGATQTISSAAEALAKLSFAKTGSGTARVNSTMTLTTPTFPGSQAFTFLIPSGTTLTTGASFNIPAGTIFEIAGGGTVLMTSATTLTVNGGTFKTSGTNDVFVQTAANKGKIGRVSGRWTFLATSGTVDLTGFTLDFLDTNGMQITGSTNLTNLNGGQFTNLFSAGRGITLNTTGTVPSTPTNVGFNWGAFNSVNSGSTCLAGTYYTVYASNCSNSTITFSDWFGNWWPGQQLGVNCNPEDKIYDNADGGACSISMAASASPVSVASLVAKPYNTAVAIEWETGAEIDHQGFNVYRSQEVGSGYVQINSSLVRNIISSTSNRGKYRFIDTQVTNGTLYYYMIEDVAINGTKEKHGPVSATPLASLGAPPATASDTNDGGSTDPNPNTGNNPSTGPIATPGVIDLGNGVHILAQTQNSLRVEIIPPPEAWSNSVWNATYKTLKVPGYANTTTPGYPELVERTVLVEVSGQHSTAAITNASVTETAAVAKKVQPAPTWTLDTNNVLQPSYAENATAYSAAGFQPSGYYSIESSIKVVNAKAFVALKVNPFRYDAPNQLVKNASKIILDIALDGAPVWDNQPPTSGTIAAPSSADGALRMRVTQSGMYEVTYADLVAANVDGPFAGRDSSQFRVYVRGQEIPIKVVAGSSTFSSGDKIRFFVNHLRDREDDHNEVVLASYNVLGASSAPWRMDHVSADPASLSPSPEAGSYFKVGAEQDLIYLLDYPLGDGEDHYYWKRIYQPRNSTRNPYPAAASMNISVDLTRLNQTASRPVYVRVYLRARAAMSANADHHLGIYLNSTPNLIAEKVFTSDLPTRIDFALNPNYFFSGVNTLKLRALGDMIPSGDTDMIDIDRIEVEFEGTRLASSNVADFTNKFKNYYINVFGFAAGNKVVYDISQSSNRVSILDNVQWTSGDGGVTNDVAFATVDNADQDMATRYIVIKDGEYKKPITMKLHQGAYIPLKAAVNGADLIVVGEKALLAYMDRLIGVREAEGMRVVKASLEDIYAEFSNGMATSQGVKDFVTYAYNNWTAPKPKYLLLVGDATYDPRDRDGYARSDAKALTPLNMVSGVFIDFGSDNYFVANPDGTDMPLMSVGRIPTSSPAVLEDYINKVLAYENGTAAPTTAGLLKASFINDKISSGEDFAQESTDLINTLLATRPDYSTSKVDRDLVTDPVGKQSIIDEFNAGPFFMTYIGHGAEDQWGATTFFANSDADALTNTRYPIVMALNCLNAYFYDADPTYQGLGEKLIFNRNGGAIAFWGSTAMTVPTSQRRLTTAFINEFAAATSSSVHDVRLGDVQQRAKQTMGADANSRDVVRSWVLLGDPSMKLPSGVYKASSIDLSSESDSGKKGNGFLSCGSIGGGAGGFGGGAAGGGGGGFGWASFLEMVVLVGLLMIFRSLAMGRLTVIRRS